MKTRDAKRTWKDRILTAFKARDEAAMNEALAEAPTEDEGAGEGQPQRLIIEVKGSEGAAAAGAGTGDEGAQGEGAGEEAPAWFKKHADATEGRFKGIESALAKLTGNTRDEGGEGGEMIPTDDEEIDLGSGSEKEGDKGEEGKSEGAVRDKTCDAATLVTRFRDTIARAEILAPGIKLPTMDGKATRKQTVDRMCALRRRALQAAADSAETGDIVKPLLAGRSIATTTCDSLEPLFVAASELVKAANETVTSISRVHDHSGGKGPAVITDINERNRKFWAARGGLAS